MWYYFIKDKGFYQLSCGCFSVETSFYIFHETKKMLAINSVCFFLYNIYTLLWYIADTIKTRYTGFYSGHVFYEKTQL